MKSLWQYVEKGATTKKRSNLWRYLTSNSPSAKIGDSVEAEPAATSFDDRYVYWAMRNIPASEAVKHFLIMGAIGTGKTTAIQLFLQSILPRFKKGRKQPEQLIIFDAKSEIIPLLASLDFKIRDPEEGPEKPDEQENIWLLNPYDTRGHSWNIAEAIQTPMMVRHFAALAVPEEKHSSAPFFWSASRELVVAVILALNTLRPGQWDLRDLLLALESRERIKAITARIPRASTLANRILSDDQHSSGVISTMATKLSLLESVAALWHTSKTSKQFTIKNFLSEPGVLILGNDPVLRESLWPMNAMLLKALTEEILRRPNHDGPRYWFVLDEFTAMQRIECIQELVNRGRSKGASVLVGLQGIDRLNELYGQMGANDLLEQLTHKTFLRAGGPATAEWIERFFGKYRQMEGTYSENWSAGTGESSRGGSVQYNVAERSAFIASYFMNLPFTGPGKPYMAVNDVPSLGATLITQRPFDDLRPMLASPANIPTVKPRDSVNEQTLEDWPTEDLPDWGVDSVQPPGAEKSKKPALPKRNRGKAQ